MKCSCCNYDVGRFRCGNGSEVCTYCGSQQAACLTRPSCLRCCATPCCCKSIRMSDAEQIAANDRLLRDEELRKIRERLAKLEVKTGDLDTNGLCEPHAREFGGQLQRHGERIAHLEAWVPSPSAPLAPTLTDLGALHKRIEKVEKEQISIRQRLKNLRSCFEGL